MRYIVSLGLAVIATSVMAQDFFASRAPQKTETKNTTTTVTLPDKPNQTDEQGRKQGEWAKKYANGNYMYEATFEDGKPVGTVIRYYENGQKSSEQAYNADGSCTVTIFSVQGKKEAEGNFVDEKREGEWRFYAEDGTLISMQNYVAGVLNGSAKQYYETGELLSETPYENGLRSGFAIEYYVSGKKKRVTYYSKDLPHGDTKTWDESGKIIIEGKYEKGVAVGEWKYYDSELNEYFVEKHDKTGKITNQKELNARMSRKYDMQDAQRYQLQDPQNYVGHPEDYNP